MCTKLENGVLHNGQQPGNAENSHQGKFEAMKMTSGGRASHCGKPQFRDT